MRILLVHNRYTRRGGEDAVCTAEAALLRRFGHDVSEFVKDNRDIDKSALRLFSETIWSRSAYAEVSASIGEVRPHVVHFHNTLPQISPAAIHAAKAHGVATVQTLHNFRLICPSALLFRSGAFCDKCVGRLAAWPSVLHGCYRNSRAASLAVATMTGVHRRLNTWSEKVDRFIALSEPGRQTFIRGGLPAEKVSVKPNFLAVDPGVGSGTGQFALFVGRLVREKGILTLLRAWQRITSRLPLTIVGDGPLRAAVAQAVRDVPGVTWLGEQPAHIVGELMGKASTLVVPSEWNEPFGLVSIEALARGTPVLGASIGAIPTIVEDGVSGWLFRSGDAEDLAGKVEWLIGSGDAQRRRRAARARFLAQYSAERNYETLARIYREAIRSNQLAHPPAEPFPAAAHPSIT